MITFRCIYFHYLYPPPFALYCFATIWVANIPTFDNVSDLNNVNGFTIALGQIDSSGNVTGATTTDPLTNPISYFYITSTSNATTGNIQGGGPACSAGPVTLKAL